jgi:beta-lactamase regulating signal transducer with metallopeptidase domain/protocatechuate 3,4-dioxygenase beta subunit
MDGLNLERLAGLAWRSMAILTLTWGAVTILRWRSAALRHAAWLAGLTGAAVLPIVAGFLPGWSLVLPRPPWPNRPPARVVATVQAEEPEPKARITPQTSGPLPTVATVPTARLATPAPESTATATATPRRTDPAPDRSSRRPIIRPTRGTWAQWALAVWLAGALLVGLPTLGGLAANTRRWRRASRVPGNASLLRDLARRLGIRRPVELRVGAEAGLMPLTWGTFRPVVLLPRDSADWSEARRRAVLLHELAHVARCDALTLLIGRLGLAIGWYCPLAWWAMSRLRLEAERAADDRVIGAGERASSYARELLNLARTLHTPRWTAAMAPGMVRRGTLETRMMSLFDDRCDHTPMRPGARLRLVAASAIAVALVATVRPRLATATSDDAPAKPAASLVRLSEGPERISGRVVDDQGQPAPGSEVVLRRPPADALGLDESDQPLVRVLADTEGRFAFEGLATGRYAVWANQGMQTSRRGWSEGEAVVLPRQDGKPHGPLELHLAPGRSIQARVVDAATGRPIAGATVRAPFDGLTVDPRTNAQGLATLGPLPARTWALVAWADGHARQERVADLENQEQALVHFRLTAGGRLEGVARDETGQPLPNVRTRLIAGSDYRWWPDTALTDPEGRFVFDGLPRDVSINVHTFRTDRGESSRFVRLSSDRQRLEVSLAPRPFGGSVAGIVADEQGQPIAGARVVNIGNEWFPERRETTTGPDGRFRLDDLFTNQRQYYEMGGPQPYRMILALAPGHQPTAMPVEAGPRDRPTEVKLTLKAGHTIAGRVVDESGHPIEGVLVKTDGSLGEWFLSERLFTDEEGRFRVDQLDAQALFEFTRRGHGSVSNRLLAADAGETTVVMGPLGRIAGQVVDARTERPLAAFFVHLDHGTSQQGEPSHMPYLVPMTSTGQAFSEVADGRFTLGGMTPGLPLNVTVRADGYEPTTLKRVKVSPMDSEAERVYRLEPTDPSRPRSFAGHILDGEGRAAAGVQVRLVVARQRPTELPHRNVMIPFSWPMIQAHHIAAYPEVALFVGATTDSDGRFAFADVPPGLDTELVWWGGGVVPGRKPWLNRLTPEEARAIEVRTPVPSRIMGQVVRPPGLNGPVAVRVGEKSSSVPPSEVILPEGRDTFELGSLPTGTYALSLSSLDPADPSAGRRKLADAEVTITLVGETAPVILTTDNERPPTAPSH